MNLNKKKKFKLSGALIWLGIFILALAYNLKPEIPKNIKDHYIFFKEVEEGKISSVTINYPAHEMYVQPKSPETRYLVKFTELDEEEIESLYDSDVKIDYAEVNFIDKALIALSVIFSSETFVALS